MMKTSGVSIADVLVEEGLAQKRRFKESPVVENERVKVARCDGADTAVDHFSVQLISWYDEIDKVRGKGGLRCIGREIILISFDIRYLSYSCF